MFRENLLESSPSGRKRKRWPMTVAFTFEVIVGAALIVLPLLSTGVIPVSARVSIIAPLGRPNAARPPNGKPSAGGASGPHAVITPVAICKMTCIHIGPVTSASDVDPGPPNLGSTDGLPVFDSHPTPVVPEPPKPPERIRVSVMAEGQLLNKVDPVYPHIAIVTGTKGDVRIHAIIAKDGTIQSLTVVSGHPLLVAAARDAVSRWRYRPYLLNGQPVEVETFITVSFKGIRD
jgi:periplasmic protein TonB